MRSPFFRSLLVCSLVLTPACIDNFDPALFMGTSAAGMDAPMDAELPDVPTEPDAPSDDAGFRLSYGDNCTGLTVSDIPPGVSTFPIDTTGANDTLRALEECVSTATPGNDVFVAVSATLGERWHFHVRPSVDSSVNPVLYLLDGCNEINCSDTRAVNACGRDQFEHLSVVAPATGTFILGVDTADAGGFTGNLEIYRPVCGNGGALEHSEGCDDGGLVDGDGCDALCRRELTPENRTEAGANDDHFGANHVLEPDGATVLGEIGGGCDVDYYAVDLTTGQTLTVTVSSRGAGTTCSPTAPEVRLSIVDDDGYTELEVVDPAEQCPMLSRTVTGAGTYFVRLTAPNGGGAWQYDLDLEITP